MSIPSASFSLWCDFVEKEFLENGFQELIRSGLVNGATSNPAIFQKAFGGESYAEAKAALAGQPPKAIYEALAIADIRRAAEILKPLYDRGEDGFISIEVDPHLCDDAHGTIEEGRRLHQAIGMPNVMIKVPATTAGYEAMQTLMSDDIPVNATLIFSAAQIEGCLDAMSSADKRPQGVLSVFVSRFDRKCDGILQEKALEPGRLGINNAQWLYHLVQERKLDHVRTLFASTGVKGDAYPPSYYIDELLFASCVNTAPLETLQAYERDSEKKLIEPLSRQELKQYFETLSSAGIGVDAVAEELMGEGLKAFKTAFDSIMDSL